MRRDETRALAGGGQRRLFSSLALVGSSCFSAISPFLSHRAGSKCVVGINIRGKAVPAADLPVYWPLSSPEDWPRWNLARELGQQLDLVGSFFEEVGLAGSNRWPETNKKAISISSD